MYEYLYWLKEMIVTKSIYKKLGAVHYKYFIDDFGGVKSNSEKLI